MLILELLSQNIKTKICLSTNREELISNISYYEMTMDDYKEHLLHDYYGVMDYDKNDAIVYNNYEPVNIDITELNIIDNNDGINHNCLQNMLTKYKLKKLSQTT